MPNHPIKFLSRAIPTITQVNMILLLPISIFTYMRCWFLPTVRFLRSPRMVIPDAGKLYVCTHCRYSSVGASQTKFHMGQTPGEPSLALARWSSQSFLEKLLVSSLPVKQQGVGWVGFCFYGQFASQSTINFYCDMPLSQEKMSIYLVRHATCPLFLPPEDFMWRWMIFYNSLF